MINNIIVRLSNDSQNLIEWLSLDADSHSNNNILESVQRHCEIIVLVPGIDVFLTHVKLPKLKKSQLLKAIPYAIEDLLAEETSKLHYATGKISNNPLLSVVVVSKEKMDEWLLRVNTFFQSKDPYIKILTPDILIVPWHPEQWTIYIDNDTALVRTDELAGFSIALGELKEILQLFLNHPDTHAPRTIVVIGKLPNSFDADDFCQKFHVEFMLQPETNLLLSIANKNNSCSRPEINLLQGPYKVYQFHSKRKTLYSRAVFVVIISLLILILGSIFQLIILNDQDNELQHQMRISFQRAFPGIAFLDADSAERRMKKTLSSKIHADSDNQFLKIMTNIAPTIHNSIGIKLLGLEYAADNLTLVIETNNFALLDNLSQALKMQGYKIELYEAIKSANRIQANLVIHEAL